MTDYEDYENNLAFPPTTDRTQSTIEKLTEENARLKELLKECRGYIEYVGYLGADTILEKINEVLK